MKQLFSICGIVLMLLATNNLQAQKEGEFHLDQVYALGANGTVHLVSSDADVRITGTDRSDVHVKIDRFEQVNGIRSGRRRFSVEVEEKGGDLFIEERRSGSVSFSMGSFRTEYEIVIEMPSNGSLRVRGEDDDYIIKSIHGAISISSEDGDIDIYDTKSSNIDVRLEDGDLRLAGGTGRFYANSEDGDLDIRNAAFTELEIVIEDGNVSLETTLADNGVYDIRSDDANIEFTVLSGGGKFLISKDDGRVNSGMGFTVQEETDNRVLLSLPGGSADVEIRINDGRVRLHTKVR